MQETLGKETAALAEKAPKLPLSLQFIILTVFLPEEMSFFVAGLRLTATRLLFVLLAPLVFSRLHRENPVRSLPVCSFGSLCRPNKPLDVRRSGRNQ